MQKILMLALSLHVLPAVFWAGTTFTMARTGGKGSERLFRPQMGAATLAVLTGAYLWHAAHEGVFGAGERILAAGAICALIALAVQATAVGGALAKLRKSGEDAAVRARIAVAHRAAALLLAVATLAMAAARYA